MQVALNGRGMDRGGYKKMLKPDPGMHKHKLTWRRKQRVVSNPVSGLYENNTCTSCIIRLEHNLIFI